MFCIWCYLTVEGEKRLQSAAFVVNGYTTCMKKEHMEASTLGGNDGLIRAWRVAE